MHIWLFAIAIFRLWHPFIRTIREKRTEKRRGRGQSKGIERCSKENDGSESGGAEPKSYTALGCHSFTYLLPVFNLCNSNSPISFFNCANDCNTIINFTKLTRLVTVTRLIWIFCMHALITVMVFIVVSL